MSFEQFVESNTLDLTPRPPPTGDEIVASMKWRPKVWFVSRTLMCWLGRHEWIYGWPAFTGIDAHFCRHCGAAKVERR